MSYTRRIPARSDGRCSVCKGEIERGRHPGTRLCEPCRKARKREQNARYTKRWLGVKERGGTATPNAEARDSKALDCDSYAREHGAPPPETVEGRRLQLRMMLASDSGWLGLLRQTVRL